MPSGAAHEQFSSRRGFVYAAVGSAVGLGNIWRFPFIVGENGGGAFVLLYLLFILLLGVPALMAMILIGRRGRRSPINSTRALALADGRSPRWKYLGWLAVAAAYLALSFFSVVAGWALAYLMKAAAGELGGISAAAARALFSNVKEDAASMILWHGAFMLFTIVIVAAGVRSGVERTVKFMMPALFALLLVLVVYAAMTADFPAGLRFMFTPDFSALDAHAAVLAVGQAFFSLSVGGGGLIAYGAYLARDVSIARVAGTIAAADTLAALLAGMAIFPIVITYRLETAGGPGLIFHALPIAFGQMPAGRVFGTLFFLLVFFAALSTSISMLESVVSWLEERRGRSRPMMAALAGGFAWFLGIGSVLSFNAWAAFKPLAAFEPFRDAGIFRLLDYLVANIMLPLSALLIAIFAGWIMSEAATRDELAPVGKRLFTAWRFIMRYLAPAAITGIFIAGLLAT